MALSYKGKNICYSSVGKGTAVVLIHGFLESKTMWEPFIPDLSKRNQIITIDLLGHGKTGCVSSIHSMEDMAEVVKVVLSELKISESILVGHSMGGYVALAFAEKYSNDIIGLCLMNSTAEPDTKEKRINRDRAVDAVQKNKNSFVRISITNLFRPKNRSIFARELKQVKDEALKISVDGITAALKGMKIRKDRVNLLRSLSCKKMMIIGKRDPVLDYDSLIEQTKDSKIQLVEFPDGHMSHIENKQDFLTTIMHFIE
ncbi:MAG: alpha/beta hydrolase [Flavobacteriaceae bacterium]|nr:alpha/beta hydrolase [Bacteroidia bacterium]NNL15398.1 alpha/beta hydrolase [Flavobacteriaceae bacterium]